MYSLTLINIKYWCWSTCFDLSVPWIYQHPITLETQGGSGFWRSNHQITTQSEPNEYWDRLAIDQSRASSQSFSCWWKTLCSSGTQLRSPAQVTWNYSSMSPSESKCEKKKERAPTTNPSMHSTRPPAAAGHCLTWPKCICFRGRERQLKYSYFVGN